jgi:hypothetical protein
VALANVAMVRDLGTSNFLGWLQIGSCNFTALVGDGKDHLIGGLEKTTSSDKDKDTFEVRSEKGHVIILDFENGKDNILLAVGTKSFLMKDKKGDTYLY